MTTRLITGKPRSGKSYYVVKKICDDFSKYDPVFGGFDLLPNHNIYSNIDGLKVNHVAIDDLIQEYGIEAVFHIDFWEDRVSKGQKTIICIDEVQKYFSRQSRFPDSVWFFFEYHGHLGLDIYLMSHQVQSVHPRILAITETYTEAPPPTLKFSSTFTYLLRDATTNTVIGRPKVKTDKKVFAAYKSATHEDGVKSEPSPFRKIMIQSVIAFVFMIFFIPLAIRFAVTGDAETMIDDSKIGSLAELGQKKVKKQIEIPVVEHQTLALPDQPVKLADKISLNADKDYKKIVDDAMKQHKQVVNRTVAVNLNRLTRAQAEKAIVYGLNIEELPSNCRVITSFAKCENMNKVVFLGMPNTLCNDINCTVFLKIKGFEQQQRKPKFVMKPNLF